VGWRRGRGIERKSPEQVRSMRAAGLVVARTLEVLREAAVPGATTGDLDALARDQLRAAGAGSSFLGYSHPPFPAVICASVGEEVVHGIPGNRVLRDGDLLSVDFGAILAGWHGDSAITVEIGQVAPEARRLSEVTREALWAGLAAAVPGGRLGDISHAIETSIRSSTRPDGGPWGILADYGGHGIGREMHMAPHVLNYGRAGTGPQLAPGVTLAIEPMVTLGGPDVETLDDGWTVVTADRTPSAHWEHTVAITQDGPWVLTALDGGAAAFAAMGVASPAAALG
jgi:methionyl aminopeptidase